MLLPAISGPSNTVSLFRGRLAGVGIPQSDSTHTKVSVWIIPREIADDKVEPSTEAVIALLDTAIDKKQFVVGVNKALSGK